MPGGTAHSRAFWCRRLPRSHRRPGRRALRGPIPRRHPPRLRPLPGLPLPTPLSSELSRLSESSRLPAWWRVLPRPVARHQCVGRTISLRVPATRAALASLPRTRCFPVCWPLSWARGAPPSQASAVRRSRQPYSDLAVIRLVALAGPRPGIERRILARRCNAGSAASAASSASFGAAPRRSITCRYSRTAAGPCPA